MSVDNILEEKLRLRATDEGSEWRLWEYKSINMHRGVLHWRPTQTVASCDNLTLAVRRQVSDSYRKSWWRGFAFGVLVEVSELPKDIALIESCLDTRATSQGSWQWIVLVCPAATTAIGVHTWIEGYLAPIYRALLTHYESLDYCTGGFKKEKDRLMQFLAAAQRLRGRGFQEFEPWKPGDEQANVVTDRDRPQSGESDNAI